MMENLGMALALAGLAGVVGYLLAMVLSKRAVTQLKADLAGHQTAQEGLEKRVQSLEEELREKTESLTEAALKTKEAQTQLASVQSRKSELEAENNDYKEQAGTLSQAKSEAEQQLASASAELKENRKSQEDLSERLSKTEDDLKKERAGLDEQKQAAADLAKQVEGLEVEVRNAKSQLKDIGEDREEKEGKVEELMERNEALMTENQGLKTSLEEREAARVKQIEQFEEQKEALSVQFKNLANKIFEEKGKSFSENNKASVEAMLKPFREQIDGFKKRVNEIHDKSLEGNAALDAEIKKVLEIGLKMSDEANNLTTALKNDSQKRGAWGEAQLQRTLEMSGLVEGAHYDKQQSFKDKENKNKITDFIVRIPGDKQLIIDSKVSLVDYNEAATAETEEARNQAFVRHINAVKKMIDDLSSKDYTSLVGMRSPGYVMMFIPIESAYIDTLRDPKDLYQYGLNKGVVLVSHTTLIPVLRTVANLWNIEQSNAEARKLGEKAGDIYNQVCVVAERLQKLGTTLASASTHYNSTVKGLVGNQGLHGKVERFQQLSSKASKSMPALESRNMDWNTEKLEVITPKEPEVEVLLPATTRNDAPS